MLYPSKRYTNNLLNHNASSVPTVVPTKIKWNVPEVVPTFGNATGYCNITDNPAPIGDLLDIDNCHYKSSSTIVDRYTVMVNFNIYNATKSCHIYCHSETHEEWKTIHISTIATNDTNNTTSSPNMLINKSTTTTAPNPSVISSQENFGSLISTNSTSPPTTNTTGATEKEISDITATERIQNNTTMNSLEIMLILLVVIAVIMLLITVITMTLVVYITIRAVKGNKTNV